MCVAITGFMNTPINMTMSFLYDVSIVDMNNTTYISGVDCHLKYLHLQICVFVHFIWCNRTIVLEFNVRMNAVTGPAAFQHAGSGQMQSVSNALLF